MSVLHFDLGPTSSLTHTHTHAHAHTYEHSPFDMLLHVQIAFRLAKICSSLLLGYLFSDSFSSRVTNSPTVAWYTHVVHAHTHADI